MHNDLYAWLSTEVTLVATFGTRMYHMSMPQSVNTFPALTFQQITKTEFAQDYEAPNDAKIHTSIYQFDVIAESSADAISGADTFDTVFRNFRGTMGSVQVQHVDLDNQTHLEERNGDKLRRRIIQSYSITYS